MLRPSLALATTVLFFLCIVLHKLAHEAIAQLSDVPVRGITLFALGGLTQIEREASTPGAEFWIAMAGPGMSFAIALGCWILATAVGPHPRLALRLWRCARQARLFR